MGRINRALLAAFLCAGGPAATAGMCDPFQQTSPFSSAQWTTLSDSVPELRGTEAAPAATSLSSPMLSLPAVALLTLPEGDAWNLVKTTVGENVVALRPTWLPVRFRTETVMIEYAYVNFARYRVGYARDDGLILVAAGAVNSAAPSESLDIKMGDVTVTYSETSSWPERQVTWIQNGVFYSVQARGVTKDELIQIARALCGPELPSTSTAPDHEPESGLR